MVKVKTIDATEKREIRDHRDNTCGELIKCYTLSQLSLMDGVDIRTIKTSKRYLPVRVDDGHALYEYKNGRLKKPYKIRYIRLDEIRALYNKRTGKKLVIE